MFDSIRYNRPKVFFCKIVFPGPMSLGGQYEPLAYGVTRFSSFLIPMKPMILIRSQTSAVPADFTGLFGRGSRLLTMQASLKKGAKKSG